MHTIQLNSFQRWARDYARAFGFDFAAQGNWVILFKDGHCYERMTVQGVQSLCNMELRKDNAQFGEYSCCA
jgi:hypothetical protein